MPNSIVRDATNERAETEIYENVTCPFCGMLCDDLKIERKGHSAQGPEQRLRRALRDSSGNCRRRARKSAARTSISKAIKAAAELISKSKLPLYGGLATGVEGMRAVMALADRTGGMVDHVLSEVQYRNLKVLQTKAGSCRP